MDNILEIARAIIGGIFVLFIPGYFLSHIFFKRKSIDVIERIALSFALSIAAVPLLAFYLNLIGVKISFWSIVFEIMGIIGLSILYLYLEYQYKAKRTKTNEQKTH